MCFQKKLSPCLWGNHNLITCPVVSILTDPLCMSKLYEKRVPSLIKFDISMFGVVQMQSGRIFFASFHNRAGLMTTTKHIGYWDVDEMVGFSKRISTEEDQDGSVSHHIHSYLFCHSRGLIHIEYLRKGKMINGKYDGWLNDDRKKKMAAFGKKGNAVPPKQFKGTNVRSGCSKI